MATVIIPVDPSAVRLMRCQAGHYESSPFADFVVLPDGWSSPLYLCKWHKELNEFTRLIVRREPQH